jgi:hypothetical protein
MLQRLDAGQILARVADADYESPVAVDSGRIPAGTVVRSSDGDAMTQAIIGVVRATARELRGRTCQVVGRVVDERFELLVGAEGSLNRLYGGPRAAEAGPVALERGGLGLTLIHAALVLDAHGAERWTVSDSRQLFGIRLPLGPPSP